MWGIWNSRNSLLWNNIILSPNKRVQLSFSYRRDWVAARLKAQHLTTSTTSRQTKWTKPPSPWLKYNVDAALCEAKQITGFGMILTNEQGVVLQ